MKQNKLVILLNADRGDHNFPPLNAIEFLEWVTDNINRIPEEFRDEADVEIDVDEDYGTYFPKIMISYRRPETDDEERKREEQEELELLAELQAKYSKS